MHAMQLTSSSTFEDTTTSTTTTTTNSVSGNGSNGTGGSNNSNVSGVGNPNSAVGSSHHIPKLRDCIMLKPGSTVSDVYDALKRGALPHVIVHGDFVRAEGKGLDSTLHKKRQLGRDTAIDESCVILRIQTNRKAVWQQHVHHQNVAPGVDQ